VLPLAVGSMGQPPAPPSRPPWLQWLILAIFLWSSWQVAGFWFQQLRG
jgi:hypothetical protein